MHEGERFYLTTAIDYPNNRPHIGHAFEKIGADVQARYRRMQGRATHFLIGNDENTVKVSKRAAELGRDTKQYVDEMAGHFKAAWKSLGISNNDFITRQHIDWGIRTPFDPAQTIYVWFDALLNYITGVGYGTDEENFRRWWPADMHVIGKDITRFHCALWPAMLTAAGIELPRRV